MRQHSSNQKARRGVPVARTRTEQAPVLTTKPPARVLDHLRNHILEKFRLDGPDEF